jgi:hAT family C-terminal dimerisation region
MYILLKTSGVDESFSNVEVILRIYLSLLVTNCSGERSFSQLKRIKNELRSTMHQERLAALSLMCIENDVVRQLNFNDIIDQFAAAKARSVHV